MSNDSTMAPNSTGSVSNSKICSSNQRLAAGAQSLPFDEVLGELLGPELRACQWDRERGALTLDTLTRALGAAVAVLGNGNATNIRRILASTEEATGRYAADAADELRGWMLPS